MNKYFVNFSNHPSERWSGRQLDEAGKYGIIVDVPFPSVDEYYDEAQIRNLSDEYIKKIVQMDPAAVLCQGEYTLAYQVANGLIRHGINVVAACSRRNVKEHDGVKEVFFEFARFRKFQDSKC